MFEAIISYVGVIMLVQVTTVVSALLAITEPTVAATSWPTALVAVIGTAFPLKVTVQLVALPEFRVHAGGSVNLILSPAIKLFVSGEIESTTSPVVPVFVMAGTTVNSTLPREPLVIADK